MVPPNGLENSPGGILGDRGSTDARMSGFITMLPPPARSADKASTPAIEPSFLAAEKTSDV